MKNPALFFLLFLSTLFVKAQQPSWAWTQSAGGVREEIGVSVVTDDAGNVYTTGTFTSNTITFGGILLTNAHTPQSDIFITKYTSAGNVIWSKSISSAGSDHVHGIAIDANENLIIVGDFGADTLIIGNDTLINNGINADDLFLTKLDSAGNPLWSRSEGGYSNESAYAVTTDHSGNVFICGQYYTPTFDYDSVTITSSGNYDILIAKYNSNGEFQWVRTSGGFDLDAAYGIAADSAGNIYAAGWFGSDSLRFGNTTVYHAGSGNFDVFLVKYNTDGDVEWASRMGGVARESLRSITLDRDQNIYMVGEYTSTDLLFANDTLHNSDTVNFTYEGYLIKYDQNGNELYARSFNGDDDDYLYSVTTDASGNVYICGTYTSTTFSDGNLTFTNSGNANTGDLFVVKLDANGNSIWGAGATGALHDYANSICVSGTSEVYLTGGFYSPALTIGGDTLVDASSNSDYFVAKMSGTNVIQELPGNERISIWPNPSSSLFRIMISSDINFSKMQIGIYDILGKRIDAPMKLEDNNNLSFEVDLSKHQKGLYFIQFKGEMQCVIKKLLLQ